MKFLGLIDRFRRIMIRQFNGATVGVRAIITNENEEVLLVRHTYSPGFYTPGGGVDQGETLLDALKREVSEETGLEVRGVPKLFAVYNSECRGVDDYPFFYHVSEFSGHCHIPDAAEIAEIRWFRLDENLDELSPKTRKLLREFKGASEIRETW